MYQILYLLFIFVSVFAAFQSEPLYVPVKFHDLPSEKPENTSIDTEKSKQNFKFYSSLHPNNKNHAYLAV